MKWITNFFKNHDKRYDKIKKRAQKFLSPCVCGNSDYREDKEKGCYICNACGQAVPTYDFYLDRCYLDNLEERRKYGRGWLDLLFDDIVKEIDSTNKKPHLRIVKD